MGQTDLGVKILYTYSSKNQVCLQREIAKLQILLNWPGCFKTHAQVNVVGYGPFPGLFMYLPNGQIFRENFFVCIIISNKS